MLAAPSHALGAADVAAAQVQLAADAGADGGCDAGRGAGRRAVRAVGLGRDHLGEVQILHLDLPQFNGMTIFIVCL